MLIRCMALIVLTAILGACAPSRDGELLWQFQIKKSHMQWGVVDEGRLYLCADDVYCLDIATGRLLWEFKTFGTHASAPVADDGRLYFQCGGLYALDAATGRVLWEFWTNDWATVAPAVGAGRVYAPAGDRLYCLDAADGKRLWSLRTGSLETTPIVNGERLVIRVGCTVQCLDAADGKVLWQLEPGQADGHLVAGGDCVYSSDSQGFVQSHAAATGALQWRFNSSALGLPRIAILSNGDVLVSAGASLNCLRPGNSVPLWTFTSGNDADLGVPRILGHHIYVRDAQGQMYCLSLDDGTYVDRILLPTGGRVLTDGTEAIFLPGGKERTVICRPGCQYKRADQTS
ncbi:MAG: hypothetical protein FJ119_13430 [Deltaproteobacteria bacterium]|nr:hypothetical protein [Deltaproteobacteria bacterium]